jgi:hypothetical protein
MVDGEKIKWMIQRKKRLHYTEPLFQDDSWNSENKELD